MNTTVTGKLRVLVAAVIAVLWSLIVVVAGVLLGYTDEITRSMNELVGVPPELARWLASAALVVEQWGAWLMAILWLIGLAVLAALYWFADRILHVVNDFRRKGALS